MRKFYFLLLSACFFALQGVAQSYSLHEWNFAGGSGEITGKEESSAAKATYVDLESTSLTRGEAALGNHGYSNGFVASLPLGTTEEDAVKDGFYFEFKVKTKEGSKASLSSIFAQLRVQYTVSYRWKYSLNNGEFKNLMDVPVTMDAAVVGNVGVDQPEIDMSGIAELQNIPSSTTVTFRLYAWGGTNNNQGFGFGKSAAAYNTSTSVYTYKSSLVLNGTVESEEPMLAGWDFSLLHLSTASDALIPTRTEPNVGTTSVSRGPGLVVGALRYGYASTTAISETKNPDAYYDIVTKADGQYKISLSSINYLFRRNASGVSRYQWAYSTDGGLFTDIDTEADITTDGNGLPYSVDLSGIAELQNLTSDKTITLRMYVWGATNETNVFGFGRYLTNSVGIQNTFPIYLKGRIGDTAVGITPGQMSENNMYVVDVAGNSVLKVNSNVALSSKLQITDMTGKTVYSALIRLNEGENEINLPANLAKGIYVISADGQSVKFIK